MNALSYRPSFAARLAAWGTFLVFFVGAAWIGAERPDGFGWALAHDAAQIVSAAALAFAGVSSILEWRARRRWNAAIQVIAVDLLNSLVRDTGGVMSRLGNLLLGNSAAVRQLDYAFQLPWTKRSEEQVKARLDGLTELGLAAIDDPADAREMMDRLQGCSQDLRARGDRLRDAATALDSYIGGDHVMPLLAQVGWLRRRVQILCDFADNPDGVQPADVAATALKSLDTGLAIAGAISEPVNQIRREIEDVELEKELNENELALAVRQAFEGNMEAADRANEAAERLEVQLSKMSRRSQKTRARVEKLRELEGRGD